MFANTNMGVMNMAMPNVCLTPAVPAPLPIPYPSIGLSTMHIPNVPNVIICCGMAENLLTPGTITNGSEPGVVGGVVSGLFIGPDEYLLGSTKVLMNVAFATHLTSLTGQNGKAPNTAGASLTPAQCCVIILS